MRRTRFPRPSNLEQWVREYVRTPKDDIRRNRANAAERLGFIGRVMHGRNPRTWLGALRARVGEPVDYSLAVEKHWEGGSLMRRYDDMISASEIGAWCYCRKAWHLQQLGHTSALTEEQRGLVPAVTELIYRTCVPPTDNAMLRVSL